ncbi:site-2 protease family protein [Lacimonas salitolerans]|uniref:Zinc metalloprotease n=1 Tax=Lacimonas salitolerans TaxID=1323750 RepID=A0ABW4EBN4_9RHOB
MSWSFPIGTIRGTEIRIHATFFLLLAWIVAVAGMAGGAAAAVENLVFILALFACVVLHELGHVFMARRYGIRTPDITLLPIGGLARLERMPEDPKQEIAVALAGPAVNVVIWLILTLVLGATVQTDAIETLEDPDQGFVQRLAMVNLILVLFNMIPAFPMDGGRVFRAVLALFTDRVRATRIAARTGQALAFGFGFLGLTSGNPWLVLIAVFIFFAAGAESSDTALQDRAKGAMARDAMITAYEALSPHDTVDTAAQAVLRSTQAEFPVIGADGRLVGILTRASIITEVQADRRTARVETAMTTDIPGVQLTTPMEAVLRAMQDSPPGVAVTDRTGHFVGYITRENIGEWLILSRH